MSPVTAEPWCSAANHARTVSSGVSASGVGDVVGGRLRLGRGRARRGGRGGVRNGGSRLVLAGAASAHSVATTASTRHRLTRASFPETVERQRWNLQISAPPSERRGPGLWTTIPCSRDRAGSTADTLRMEGTLGSPPSPRRPRRSTSPRRAARGVIAVVVIVVVVPGRALRVLRAVVGALPAARTARSHPHRRQRRPGDLGPLPGDPLPGQPRGRPGELARDHRRRLRRHLRQRRLVFLDAGETRNRSLAGTFAPGSTRGEPVLIFWSSQGRLHSLQGDTVGLGGGAAIEVDGRPRLVTGVIALDRESHSRTYDPLTTRSQQLILEHEIGHVLGLDHVDDSRPLMNASYVGQDGLGAGDIAGLRALHAVPCG